MECSVLNTCGMLNGKVAKSSSREKLWKSWAEVEWRFWNSWSCYYYKADIILVYRGFTKIPKPVVSQRSQSKERPEQKLFPLNHIPVWSENIHFTMLKRDYEAACDRYQQHKPELFRVSKTQTNLCTAIVFIYKYSEWGASPEVLKTTLYVKFEIISFIY